MRPRNERKWKVAEDPAAGRRTRRDGGNGSDGREERIEEQMDDKSGGRLMEDAPENVGPWATDKPKLIPFHEQFGDSWGMTNGENGSESCELPL